MSTVWWILWSIGIVDVYVGMVLSWKSDRKKVLMGWMLMTIGLVFNGAACLVNNKIVLDPIMAVISFIMAHINYKIFKSKKKEFDIKELGIKEKFLRDLSLYKFKLDRKKHKIV